MNLVVSISAYTVGYANGLRLDQLPVRKKAKTGDPEACSLRLHSHDEEKFGCSGPYRGGQSGETPLAAGR